MHTPHGLARLVGFSDGVVAIAITLLVLPLVDSVAQTHGDMVAFLANNQQQLFAFVLSFAVIGNFWVIHHQLYELVIDYRSSLLWVNLLWLMSIVFLPFPTALLASSVSDDPLTYVLYIGTLVFTTAANLGQRVILVRHPELLAENVRGTLRLTRSIVPIAVMLVALVLAVTIPGFGLWGLVLLIFSGVVERRFDRPKKVQL